MSTGLDHHAAIVFPAWVPREVQVKLKKMRHSVEHPLVPVTSAEHARQDPAEIVRRLAVIERLGSHKEMKSLWDSLSREEHISLEDASPPERGYIVEENSYRRVLRIPDHKATPDQRKRLIWARMNIVHMAGHAAMQGGVNMTGPEIEKRIAAAQERLDWQNRIIEHVMNDHIVSDEWKISMASTIVILQQDLNRAKSQKALSNREGRFVCETPHIIAIARAVEGMFGSPKPAIVGHCLSAAFGKKLTRENVSQIVKADKQREARVNIA